MRWHGLSVNISKSGRLNGKNSIGGNKMNLPSDPVMLLSYVNTKLRDDYSSLDELCSSLGADKDDICSRLAMVNYFYDEELNKFV